MSERGAITFGPVIGVIVIILAFVGLLAICNENEEVDTLGRIQWASHEYDERDRCYGEECYSYDERSGGSGDGRGGDGRFGGGRSGDYDGGPGDDCRNACGNTIIVPTPGNRDRERDQR
jgi:hypothetical protein